MPPRRNAPAAEGGAAPQPGLLSIILPTYNEADNLPIVIWLLARELSTRCAQGGRNRPAREGGVAVTAS